MTRDNDLSIAELCRAALGVGLTHSEFWDLTPRETVELIEARSDVRRRSLVQTAWLTAKFMRAKRIPSLAAALNSRTVKRVSRSEIVKRRGEFSALKKKFNAAELVKKIGDLKDA